MLWPGQPSAQAAPVYFPNNGFETFPGGTNNWTWEAGWVWDSNVSYSGSRSAKIYRGSGGQTNSIWSAHIGVQPSTNYTLTYWLRTQNATNYPSVNIYQYDSAGNQTGPRVITHVNVGSGTNNWMLVTHKFQTMPNVATFRVRLFLWTETTGTFWFDNFVLDRGSAATYPFQQEFPLTASGSIFFSSPVVADLDGDGTNEVLVAGGNAVNGWSHSGAPLNNFPLITGDKHIIGHLALADFDNDQDLEIVAGTRTPVTDGRGRVFVWHHTGATVAGWPKSVAWNTTYGSNDSWVSSVAIADLDNDQDLEIIAGTTNNASYYSGPTPPTVANLYAWHHNGALLNGGWPNGYNIIAIYGMIAVGDFNGSGVNNVVTGRDFTYMNTYVTNGASLAGWPIETYVTANNNNYATDVRIEHGFSAPILADLENDGSIECIVMGNTKGPGDAGDIITGNALLVLNSDGTRHTNWANAAVIPGAVDSQDMPPPAPAVADIDGDGKLEIIVAAYNGSIRAYNDDKSLLWTFDFTQGANIFAGEPVIGDVDGDGALEILFGTYVPRQWEGQWDGPVGLWGLEANGTVMSGFPLPIDTPGLLGAPTLADLDKDGDLEILAGSRIGQLLVWDTPTSSSVWLPWSTGRHDLQRTATFSPIFNAGKTASPRAAHKGESVTYTIHLQASRPVDQTIYLTDIIPTGLTYIPGTLSATTGTVSRNGSSLLWNGSLLNVPAVDITYQAAINTDDTQTIYNTVNINTGPYGNITQIGSVLANYLSVYLPVIFKI